MSPLFSQRNEVRVLDGKLTLQPRLRAIADLVPEGGKLVDVGTDHGYIPAVLLLEEKIFQAIASDIGREPLAHAVRTAETYGVPADRIDFRLCDGLAGIGRAEADCIVIAGMGGDNIVSILEAAPWTKDGVVLLLQPMSKAEVLRAWLPVNGYAVTAEQLVADKGVIYPILTVSGGSMQSATEAQAWGGFLLGNDALWGRYLDDRLLRLHRAVSGLKRARSAEMHEKRASLLAVIKELEERKGEWLHANNRPGD